MSACLGSRYRVSHEKSLVWTPGPLIPNFYHTRPLIPYFSCYGQKNSARVFARCTRVFIRKFQILMIRTDPIYQRNAIRTHYSTKAVFDDPLVTAKGWRAIEAQFKFLTFCTCIQVSQMKLLECTTTTQDTLQMDAIVTFTFFFGWLSLPLRIISNFQFGQDGRIVHHEDVWSIRDLLASIWIVGWIYQGFRGVLGWLATLMIGST